MAEWFATMCSGGNLCGVDAAPPAPSEQPDEEGCYTILEYGSDEPPVAATQPPPFWIGFASKDDDNEEVADDLQAFVQSACDSVGEKWPAGVKPTVITKAVEAIRAEGYGLDTLRSEDFDDDAWDELKRLLKMKEEIGSFRANQLIRQLKTASSSESGA